MKRILHFLVTLMLTFLVNQHLIFPQGNYVKSSGTIIFFSSAPIEDIKAENQEFASEIDITNRTVSFKVKISDFVFNKKLMRQHFNEQYMESEKYPFSLFEGKLEESPASFPAAANSFRSKVTGILTIKGISRNLNADVLFSINNDELTGSSKFNVKLEDFNIKIPKMLIKNIAEVVEVTVNVKYIKAG